ncbi:MAG: prepilin-type N-terminal cleavage/methylation domain-containing protein [Deltaproteobacteria bacterium]|nr:MAG: prepilin-type N-terminal cleavage/methylation domain-containing protein [Deltaproteobacteria bacterium]
MPASLHPMVSQNSRWYKRLFYRYPASGFTLIELSVVIIVIGVILTIALPEMRDLTEMQLRSHSRRMAGTIKYLFNQSAIRGNAYCILRIDQENGEYWPEICRPDSENPEQWVCQSDPSILGQKVRLPETLSFADIYINGQKIISDEPVPIFFLPQGYVDPGVIYIRDSRERTYTLQIFPFSGRVRIYDEYVAVN